MEEVSHENTALCEDNPYQEYDVAAPTKILLTVPVTTQNDSQASVVQNFQLL